MDKLDAVGAGRLRFKDETDSVIGHIYDATKKVADVIGGSKDLSEKAIFSTLVWDYCNHKGWNTTEFHKHGYEFNKSRDNGNLDEEIKQLRELKKLLQELND